METVQVTQLTRTRASSP